MKFYLYSFDYEWRDIWIKGFVPLTKIQKDIVEENIKIKFKNGGVIELNGFGETTESIETLEEVLEYVTFTKISKIEFNSLKRIFGEYYGTLGPINVEEISTLIEDIHNECEDCGDGDYRLCKLCSEEDEVEEDDEDEDDEDINFHNLRVESLTSFIKKEFSLVANEDFDRNVFEWKPTPSAELHIVINKFSEHVKNFLTLTLKNKGRLIEKKELNFSEWHNRQQRVKNEIQILVDRAKKLF